MLSRKTRWVLVCAAQTIAKGDIRFNDAAHRGDQAVSREGVVSESSFRDIKSFIDMPLWYFWTKRIEGTLHHLRPFPCDQSTLT